MTVFDWAGQRRSVSGIAVGLGFAALVSFLLIPPSKLSAETTRAPSFRVKDVEGRVLDLDELRRKGPVLLDFWATWCKPCIKSLPELQAWHEKFGPSGLSVIGISVDGPRNRARVRPFAKRLGLEYPIVVDDDGRLQHLYQVLAIPTAVLVDTTGHVTKVRIAYQPGEGAAFEQAIRSLIGGAREKDSAEARIKSGSSKP